MRKRLRRPVSALRFTTRGVVAAPDTVQIRIGGSFDGRVSVGAPTPTRDMTPGEVMDNVSRFVAPGPRAHPVRHVTLSGIPRAFPVSQVVDHAIGAGVKRVTLHLEPGREPGHPAVAVASAIRNPEEVSDLPTPSHVVSVTVPLEHEVLALLPAIARRLAGVAIRGVTLLWPFPGYARDRMPPPVSDVRRALGDASADLAPLDWRVKGLPRCTLQGLPLAGRIQPTTNRHYVDADHQGAAALLFRPDLVDLAKVDACRFCKADHRCDGVAREWLEAGLTGGLSPVEDMPTPQPQSLEAR